MDQKLSLSQRGIVHLLAIVIGLGLLAVLAFSLNALFASRMQQPPQTAGQPEFGRQLNDEIIEQPSATPTVVTSQTDPTAGWETYVNKQEGYSIKYPDTWTLHKAEGYTFFTSPDLRYDMSLMVEGIQISIDTYVTKKSKTYASLEEFAQELGILGEGGRPDSPDAIMWKQHTSLGNLPALWIKSRRPPFVAGGFSLLIQGNQKFYLLTCSYELSREDEARETFELVTDTFHIVE